MSANLSSAMSKTSAADKGLTIAPLYGLIMTVPSFSRARSASRTGDRLTSNFSAKSASAKWSPGLKTSSRIASRILLTTRVGTFSVSGLSFAFLRVEGLDIDAEFSSTRTGVSDKRSSKEYNLSLLHTSFLDKGRKPFNLESIQEYKA